MRIPAPTSAPTQEPAPAPIPLSAQELLEILPPEDCRRIAVYLQQASYSTLRQAYNALLLCQKMRSWGVPIPNLTLARQQNESLVWYVLAEPGLGYMALDKSPGEGHRYQHFIRALADLLRGQNFIPLWIEWPERDGIYRLPWSHVDQNPKRFSHACGRVTIRVLTPIQTEAELTFIPGYGIEMDSRIPSEIQNYIQGFSRAIELSGRLQPEALRPPRPKATGRRAPNPNP